MENNVRFKVKNKKYFLLKLGSYYYPILKKKKKKTILHFKCLMIKYSIFFG